jgi:hypothetical protein
MGGKNALLVYTISEAALIQKPGQLPVIQKQSQT